MTTIIFVAADGAEQSVDIADGVSLMEGAVQAGIDGIDADCGGACSCATCHVYLADEWRDRVPARSAMEEEILEVAVDPRPGSRLSCQIAVAPALAGMTVRLPTSQR